jgi:hypothetical protein
VGVVVWFPLVYCWVILTVTIANERYNSHLWEVLILILDRSSDDLFGSQISRICSRWIEAIDPPQTEADGVIFPD